MEVSFESIISVENLLSAWSEFICGKRSRRDVLVFELHLMDNILSLHNDLKNKTYKHNGYEFFKINDPKPRDIHKATVRDRLLHHAIYRILYSFFDKKFIHDSYSCRLNKGIHKAINRFTEFSRKVSLNYTKQAHVLKCDVRKFFASIDHQILKDVLVKYIKNENIFWILEEVVSSFNTPRKINTGLPLGNLTSQLLVNIYMNEFDQYVKHNLKCKYYIRYADDFVIMNSSKEELENLINKIDIFLSQNLKLNLHPNKVYIKTITSGIDFLGWINFKDYKVLRTKTKRKMCKKLKNNIDEKVLKSYLGLLSFGNSHNITKHIKNVQK